MKRTWDADEARVLGRRLREARLRSGLSLRDLADRANTSASFLSRIERGQRCPSVIVAARLAAILGEDLRALLGGVLGLGVGPGKAATLVFEGAATTAACLSCPWRNGGLNGGGGAE